MSFVLQHLDAGVTPHEHQKGCITMTKTELHKVLVGTGGLAAANQVAGTAKVRPGRTGGSLLGHMVAGTGAIPGLRLTLRRHASAFAVDLAMGTAPGVLAKSIGYGGGGGES